MKFTMSEFIQSNKLDVNIRDAGATKLIAAELRSRGFQRKKMRYKTSIQWVWTNETDRLGELKSKLASINL